MAAEKLTPGRFAQIIIMLTLLIAAFTWRTLDYDTQDKLECNLTPKCTVNINDSSLIAYLEGSRLIIMKPTASWVLTSLDKSLELEENETMWEIELGTKQVAEFYFKKNSTDQKIEVSFNVKS